MQNLVSLQISWYLLDDILIIWPYFQKSYTPTFANIFVKSEMFLMIKSHFKAVVEECNISFSCKSPGICWMDFPLFPTLAADSNMQIWEKQIHALYIAWCKFQASQGKICAKLDYVLLPGFLGEGKSWRHPLTQISLWVWAASFVQLVVKMFSHKPALTSRSNESQHCGGDNR